jgi:hypothetical protein
VKIEACGCAWRGCVFAHVCFSFLWRRWDKPSDSTPSPCPKCSHLMLHHPMKTCHNAKGISESWVNYVVECASMSVCVGDPVHCRQSRTMSSCSWNGMPFGTIPRACGCFGKKKNIYAQQCTNMSVCRSASISLTKLSACDSSAQCYPHRCYELCMTGITYAITADRWDKPSGVWALRKARGKPHRTTTSLSCLIRFP